MTRVDHRLLELQLHFSAVLKDLEAALSDIKAFEELMERMNIAFYAGEQNDILDYVDPIQRWFVRDLLMTIRRLVDDDRRQDVHSLVRLLRRVRRLNTRDIYGVFFDAATLDGEIATSIARASDAVDLATHVVAHNTGVLGPALAPQWKEMFATVRFLAELYDGYAARFYEHWDRLRPERFPQSGLPKHLAHSPKQ